MKEKEFELCIEVYTYIGSLRAALSNIENARDCTVFISLTYNKVGFQIVILPIWIILITLSFYEFNCSLCPLNNSNNKQQQQTMTITATANNNRVQCLNLFSSLSMHYCSLLNIRDCFINASGISIGKITHLQIIAIVSAIYKIEIITVRLLK